MDEPHENLLFQLIPDIRRLLYYQYICAMDRVALRRTCKDAARYDKGTLNSLWPRAWMTYVQQAIAPFPVPRDKKEAFYADREWINKARKVVLCSRIDNGPLLTTQPWLHVEDGDGYAIIWSHTAVYYSKSSSQWSTYASATPITDTDDVLKKLEMAATIRAHPWLYQMGVPYGLRGFVVQ